MISDRTYAFLSIDFNKSFVSNDKVKKKKETPKEIYLNSFFVIFRPQSWIVRQRTVATNQSLYNLSEDEQLIKDTGQLIND